MEISERHEGKIAVLAPIGRLDNETSAEFQNKLLFALAAGGVILVDFSGVEYISSAGLRALMMAAKKAKAGSGKIAVAALTPMVKEIFAISRFALIVQVFDSIAEAAAALA